jgi:DNA-binding MarR family transcriptional regulator
MDEKLLGNLLGALALHIADEVSTSVNDQAERTDSRAEALMTLRWHEGMKIAELRACLALTHSGAVRLIDRLQSDGFVVRRDGDDARSVGLFLTSRGQAEANRLVRQRYRPLQQLTTCLTREQQEVLADLVSKMLSSVPRTRLEALRNCRLCDQGRCLATIACPVDCSVTPEN